MAKTIDNRSRNWAIELWQESTVENWQEILSDDLKITWAASPLHQFDKQKDGTDKKPHWHLALSFEGNKSFDQIQEIADMLHSPTVRGEINPRTGEVWKAPRPEPIRDFTAYIKYFIHKNDPKKYQYKKEDILSHGIDIEAYFGLSSSEMQAECRKMIDFIEDNGVNEFSDFVVMCHQISPDWEYILMNRNTSFFKAYLYNRAMKAKQEIKQLEQAKKLYEEIADYEARIQQAENKYLRDEKGI